MDDSKKVHEAVEVARLDTARFVIAQFAKDDKKPPVYEVAINFITKALACSELPAVN